MRVDAGDIVALAQTVMSESIYQITESDEYEMTPLRQMEWIDKLNAEPSSLLMVAVIERNIVGLLDFHGKENRKKLAHVGSFGMSVSHEFRDQGIGVAMLHVLLDWARAHPTIEKVSLAVLATNTRAIHVYRKLGFIEEGRRVREARLTDGRYVDDILMYVWVGK